MESLQSLSERKKRLLLHEEAVRTNERLLDVFRCVERLSETSPAALRKLVQRDSLIAAVPRTDAEPAFKVDTRELLRRLPLHVMACVLAQEPREEGDWMASKLTSQELSTASWHGHVTKALRLLCLLCALAPSLPALASALTDTAYQDNVIDAVVLVLLSMAGPDHSSSVKTARHSQPKSDAAERVHLLPAALRALSAVLLADHKVGRGQQQQQRSATHHLCAKLLAHPRADIFLDVVFDAVRTLYRMVRVALEAEGDEAVDVSLVAFEAGLSMEWVSDLCCTPLFYHSLVVHDESLAAPLRLIWAGLDLHTPPFAPPPYSVEGAASPGAVPAAAFTTSRGDGSIELLAARSLALLRSLTEFEHQPFLDQASESPATKELARHTATRATHFAGLVMRRASSQEHPVQSAGEGQMAVNALQVLEVLADDTNFRAMAMELCAPPAAVMLTQPPGSFESAWCAGKEAHELHRSDFSLDGVPILVGPHSVGALKRLDNLERLLRAEAEDADAQSAASASKSTAAAKLKQHTDVEALQRCLTVFEILGNLHCFNAQCDPEMEGLFALLLCKEITKRAAAGTPADADARMSAPRGALQTAVDNLTRLRRHVHELQERAEEMEIVLVSQQDQLLLSQLIDAVKGILAASEVQA